MSSNWKTVNKMLELPPFLIKDKMHSYLDFQAFCKANPLPIRSLSIPDNKNPSVSYSGSGNGDTEQETIYSTKFPHSPEILPKFDINFATRGYLDYPRGLLPSQFHCQEHIMVEPKGKPHKEHIRTRMNKKPGIPVAVIDIKPSIVPAHLLGNGYGRLVDQNSLKTRKDPETSSDGGSCYRTEKEEGEINHEVSAAMHSKSLKKKRKLSENRIAYLKRNKARYKTRKRREKRLAMNGNAKIDVDGMLAFATFEKHEC
ncbi:4290_t:CDS:2 [Acaulospora colombiana]|uniref:4290_t:CDS:1 n=1 Tax=Acaulospora colombiana TaxID=27376 RepID=A0ACA9K5J5_9GLOM|nr:4290_t:CDS:2 [Acaulospora colombiana]